MNKQITHTYRALVALSVFLAFAQVTLADDGGARLAGELRQSMEGVTDLSANFVQTTFMESVELERVTGGKVAFKRGGRMRWSYEGNDPQLLVSDGEIFWVHQIRDRIAIRQDIGDLTPSARVALDLLGGFSGAERHFSLTACGRHCLELVPLVEDPNLKKVRVELGSTPLLPVKVVTEDPVGNITTIELSHIEVNTGLGDDIFEFALPEGVDLFDSEGRPW